MESLSEEKLYIFTDLGCILSTAILKCILYILKAFTRSLLIYVHRITSELFGSQGLSGITGELRRSKPTASGFRAVCSTGQFFLKFSGLFSYNLRPNFQAFSEVFEWVAPIHAQ